MKTKLKTKHLGGKRKTNKNDENSKKKKRRK